MKVYIAGPYTKGDVAVNVRNAIAAGDQILSAGHYPYIPHLTHFWHLLYPKPYERWLDIDAQWISQCEALIRLPGESDGADKEVIIAWKLGIPVFFGLDNFFEARATGPVPTAQGSDPIS